MTRLDAVKVKLIHNERSHTFRRWGRVLQIAILGSRGIPARYGGFETFVEKLSEMLLKNQCETQE